MDIQAASGNQEQFSAVSEGFSSNNRPFQLAAIAVVVIIIVGIILLSAHLAKGGQSNNSPSSASRGSSVAKHPSFIPTFPIPIASNSAFVTSLSLKYQLRFVIKSIQQTAGNTELSTNITGLVVPRIYITKGTQIVIKNNTGKIIDGKVSDLHPGETVWTTTYYDPQQTLTRWSTTEIQTFPY